MIFGTVINTAILCAIMFLVARHEADYSFYRVSLISFGLGICNILLPYMLGTWGALIVVLGLAVWALHQFCYLRWSMAGVITGLYLIAQIALGVVLRFLTS